LIWPNGSISIAVFTATNGVPVKSRDVVYDVVG
jgi:hypothetical protein